MLGIAFFGSYVFHGLLIYPIVRALSGFRWSASNARTGAIYLFSIAAVFYGFHLLPVMWATGLGVLVMLASAIFSIRVLLELVSYDQVPRSMRRVLNLLTIARAKPK